MDVDTNASRGEQVTYHYLSGAVTNYGGKSTLDWGEFEGESKNKKLFVLSFREF